MIDSVFQEEFVGSLWSWTDQVTVLSLFSDLLSIPFTQISFILQRIEPSNADYHILFLLTAYPGLYLITM